MKNKNDLVSIIIRTKDRLGLLPRAIESVFSQTYPNIELVIINDGGEDVSGIINYFKKLDKPVDVIRDFVYISNKRPLFRASAANVGIEAASGKYIGFLDDDDFLYTEHIEEHIRAQNEHNTKVSISKGVESIEEINNKKITEKQKLYHFPAEINKLALHFFENYFPFNSIIFQKDILRETGKIDSNLFVLEDWDFIIRMFLKNEPFLIDRVTCAFTTRGGASNIRMSSEYKKTWQESFKYVMEKYRKVYKDSTVAIPISEISNFLTYHSVEWYGLTKENEELRDSFAYKIYRSKLYLIFKKIGRVFKKTRG